MNRRLLAYWIATGIFCAVLGFSGFAHFTHLEQMVESMTRLGYPLYFMTIIGAAKIVGVATLLAPKLPHLKEWAYAGFTFNMLGATASHAFSGDHLSETVRPAIVLGICVLSYLLRPEDRRLPSAPIIGASSSPSEAMGAAQQS